MSTVGKRTGGTSNPWEFFKGIVTNKFWWLGIACSGLATLGYYIAMAQYDLSQVQPMMVLNPVLTALMGFCILKEVLTKRIVVAICFVVAGLLYSVENLGESTAVQNVGTLWLYAGGLSFATLIAHLWVKDREMVDSLIMGVGFGLSAAFYKSLAMDFDLDNIDFSSVANLLVDFRTLAILLLTVSLFCIRRCRSRVAVRCSLSRLALLSVLRFRRLQVRSFSTKRSRWARWFLYRSC